jgi:hypothetical protein
MDSNSILLVAIAILVTFMTIGVWGILFALAKSRGGANAEQSAAIRGITEDCAEADRVLSSTSAKAMNAHSLKSALSPKIEKIQKMLTMNMHLLDVYFVKYTESRLAVYQAALAASEPSPLFPLDKFLSETKTKPDDKSIDRPRDLLPEDLRRPSEAEAHDLRSRIEALPLAPSSPPETVLVKGKGNVEPIEPPEIDLRTGIITVSQEEPRQAKAHEQPLGIKPAAKAAEMQQPAPKAKKTIAQPPKKKPEPKPPVLPVSAEEDVFDFEREIASKVDHATVSDIGRGALDTRALHTEKTMKWDREELSGFAGKPEAIVVEGAEQTKAGKQAEKPRDKPMDVTTGAEAKGEDGMISGEDIENTLDSFFGLGDK